MKRPSAILKRRDPDAVLVLTLRISRALARYDSKGVEKLSRMDRAWLEELHKLFRDAHQFIRHTKNFAKLPQTKSGRRAFVREMKAIHWTRNLPSQKWPEIPESGYKQLQRAIKALLSQCEPSAIDIDFLHTVVELMERKARRERQ